MKNFLPHSRWRCLMLI